MTLVMVHANIHYKFVVPRALHHATGGGATGYSSCVTRAAALVLMFPMSRYSLPVILVGICTMHVTGSVGPHSPLGTNIHVLLQEQWSG